MSTLRLDAIAEEVSLAHGGASVSIRDGYADGHIEVTVCPGAPCYIVTPQAADQPMVNWPMARGGNFNRALDWNPKEARG